MRALREFTCGHQAHRLHDPTAAAQIPEMDCCLSQQMRATLDMSQTYAHAEGCAAKITFFSRRHSSHRRASGTCLPVPARQRASARHDAFSGALHLCRPAAHCGGACPACPVPCRGSRLSRGTHACLTCVRLGAQSSRRHIPSTAYPGGFSSRRWPCLQVQAHIMAHRSGGGCIFLAACHAPCCVQYASLSISSLKVGAHSASGADDTHTALLRCCSL